MTTQSEHITREFVEHDFTHIVIAHIAQCEQIVVFADARLFVHQIDANDHYDFVEIYDDENDYDIDDMLNDKSRARIAFDVIEYDDEPVNLDQNAFYVYDMQTQTRVMTIAADHIDDALDVAFDANDDDTTSLDNVDCVNDHATYFTFCNRDFVLVEHTHTPYFVTHDM